MIKPKAKQFYGILTESTGALKRNGNGTIFLATQKEILSRIHRRAVKKCLVVKVTIELSEATL